MIRRLFFVSILVVGLAALIVYSQLRTELQTVSGTIEAHDIRLGSRVGGRVEKVHAYEGQQVERDALLIELAPYDLLEKENEATRTLAAREAEYQRVVNGYRPEEIAQKKAGYDQLQARLDLLEAGPRDQEVEASRARRRVAQAALELAKQLHQRNAADSEMREIPPSLEDVFVTLTKDAESKRANHSEPETPTREKTPADPPKTAEPNRSDRRPTIAIGCCAASRLRSKC